RAAFLLDRTLGRRRNEGIERELHLPPPRLLSRAMTLKLFPGVAPRNLTGGAQWYDYQMVQNDRLTYAFAEAADRAGAVLLNYVEAIGAIKEGATVAGMDARDVETGRSLSIRARLTVNAAGAHAGRVRRMFGIDQPHPLLATMNLVARKPPKEVALAAPTADGRMLTLVPWSGHVVVGTSHSAAVIDDPDVPATSREIDGFIQQANEAFPALALTREDVTLVHRGLVPAVTGAPHAELQAAPTIVDHTPQGTRGAMTVIGVKYTTARGVAERTIDKAARILGQAVRRSATATALLPAAGIGDHAGLAIETAKRLAVDLPPATITRLSEVYADAAADVIRLMAEDAHLRETLAPGSPAVAAEIVYVIRRESAIHLTDVLLRRTGLGAAGHPGAEVLRAASAVAARELGWDESRRLSEVAAVEATYRVPQGAG
ncbi:MAG TPA: FAD-dependent oxidoreductase, partial [Gemmatimonadaceae bacterium]|nr:FAD-dependent oxidoreductase [Gemmatimonadaceae bacterium]